MATGQTIDYGPADIFTFSRPPAGGKQWYKSLYMQKAIRPLQTMFDMGFMCLVCVCILNAGFTAFNYQITHSWFLDTPIGSILRSLRFSSQWWLLALTHVRVILIWTSCFSQTVPESTFRHLIHIIGGVIVMALDLALLVVFALNWMTCNTNGDPNNMCNDPLYCCVYFTNPLNNCPNSIACVPAVGQMDLKANPDFLWIFWTTMAGLICDCCVVLPAAILWGSYSYLYSYGSEESLQGVDSQIGNDFTEGEEEYKTTRSRYRTARRRTTTPTKLTILNRGKRTKKKEKAKNSVRVFLPSLSV